MQYIFLIALLWYLIDRARHPKHLLKLDVYFGVPGSGKTTFAAYLARKSMRESIVIRLCKRFPNRFTLWILRGENWKREIPVLSNVPIKGTYELDPVNDIGNVDISDCKMLIDEAGIEFNNRNHKSFPFQAIRFFKLHRHYRTSIDVFSQSYDDMEITLRRLAQNYYVVKKSAIPFLITVKKVHRKIGVDDKTHQIMDMYKFGFPVIGTRWIFCPPLWRMFDTYDAPQLPVKEWHKWHDTDTSTTLDEDATP
jgi:Zonular occludens toxin (Zot).